MNLSCTGTFLASGGRISACQGDGGAADGPAPECDPHAATSTAATARAAINRR